MRVQIGVYSYVCLLHAWHSAWDKHAHHGCCESRRNKGTGEAAAVWRGRKCTSLGRTDPVLKIFCSWNLNDLHVGDSNVLSIHGTHSPERVLDPGTWYHPGLAASTPSLIQPLSLHDSLNFSDEYCPLMSPGCSCKPDRPHLEPLSKEQAPRTCGTMRGGGAHLGATGSTTVSMQLLGTL